MASFDMDSFYRVHDAPLAHDPLGMKLNDYNVIDTITGRDEFAKHAVNLAFGDGFVSYFKLGEGGGALGIKFEPTASTGDGGKTYSGTLTRIPVMRNDLLFFTDTVGAQTVTDVGNGVLTGDGTGTINYKTGAWSLTFNSSVGVGNPITAGYFFHGEDSNLLTDIGADIGKGTIGPYVFVISKVEIAPGSVSIIDNQGNEVNDIATPGVLAGDGSGTVDYVTGDIQVTWTSPVAALKSIDASYKYLGTPKTPSETRQDLESEDDANLFTFQKDFVTVAAGADPVAETAYVQHLGDGTGRIRCRVFVNLSEAIDDGEGESPVFFEGGLFSENDVMLAYFTFSRAVKTGSDRISLDLDLVI